MEVYRGLLWSRTFWSHSLWSLGSMDEVLASLQRGQVRLRRVPGPPAPGTLAPGTGPLAEDPRDGLMTAIRQGVSLKKVCRGPPPTLQHINIM